MKNKLGLSKSKYLTGLQCTKLLWMNYHAREIFPEPVKPAASFFDQGNQVTQLAHALFPEGIEITEKNDLEAAVKETQCLLERRKTLFEPAFRGSGTFARADVLEPNPENLTWDLYEVKSAARVKDTHLQDAAFQTYCYESAGLIIRRIYILHMNTHYVRRGRIQPEALFTKLDVTSAVRALTVSVGPQVQMMQRTLEQPACPEIKIGPQCDSPHPCALKEVCWDFIPKQNLFLLNKIQKSKAFELLDNGVLSIQDLSDDEILTPHQKIQWAAHRQNKIHIHVPALKAYLEKLRFPVFFLDFETVGNAIPFYDHCSPFQQVPFQFSLHILSGWMEMPEHHSFLAQSREEPRPEFLRRLKALLGKNGNILAYNISSELGWLEAAVKIYPEYRVWLEEITPRFMDLSDPFRNFDYYDPRQMGRTSIKNVFPALTGGTYEGLKIRDGMTASQEFARVIFGEGVSEVEKTQVLESLEIYCRLDTQAMIDILQVLRKSVIAVEG